MAATRGLGSGFKRDFATEAVEIRYVLPTHPASEPARFFNYVKTISMML
jgi:hypothetical protein